MAHDLIHADTSTLDINKLTLDNEYTFTSRIENVQKFPERTQNSDEQAFLSSIAVKKCSSSTEQTLVMGYWIVSWWNCITLSKKGAFLITQKDNYL